MKIRNKSIFIDKLYGQYQNSEFSQSKYNPPLLTSQDSQSNESRAPQLISATQMSNPTDKRSLQASMEATPTPNDNWLANNHQPSPDNDTPLHQIQTTYLIIKSRLLL